MSKPSSIIIVTGSRTFGDSEFIERRLLDFFELIGWYAAPWTVRHGACSRFDATLNREVSTDMLVETIVQKIARVHRIDSEPMPAQWGVHGNNAGPIRNQVMVTKDRERILGCLAFLESDKPCKGTRDCIQRAINAGITTLVISK